jgi:UDP:flavonoid glycosyltransferase YjiC (YdhE family)
VAFHYGGRSDAKARRIAGQAPTGIAFDQLSQDRFYVADSVTLWGTQDQGNTIDAISLPQNLIRPTSVEFINNNGVEALLVGGLSQTANAQSPIAYADRNNGVLTDLVPFGSGLPNVQVSRMSYNPLADVLAVGTLGAACARYTRPSLTARRATPAARRSLTGSYSLVPAASRVPSSAMSASVATRSIR